jgi:hypothetical protein
MSSKEMDLQMELFFALYKKRPMSDWLYNKVEVIDADFMKRHKDISKLVEKITTHYKKTYLLCDELSVLIQMKQWEEQKQNEHKKWLEEMDEKDKKMQEKIDKQAKWLEEVNQKETEYQKQQKIEEAKKEAENELYEAEQEAKRMNELQRYKDEIVKLKAEIKKLKD